MAKHSNKPNTTTAPPEAYSAGHRVLGCQGFVDFSEPLHAIAGFPWIKPLAHTDDGEEISWTEVDRHPELRVGDLNLTAELNWSRHALPPSGLADFRQENAPTFNVGEVWTQLEGLTAIKDDGELLTEFLQILELMAGDNAAELLKDLETNAGGQAQLAAELRTLYPQVE